ncbi:MAG: lipid-A-disaccharide synthase [Rubellimicrobium sp.]|nr:lipid-A-disaccharide synthase [Rubellimicrobium sp.]
MKVFIVAGEVSGDRLGGAVMAGVRALVPGIAVQGVGGARMAEEGLASRFPMEELSVMGLAEILPRYAGLRRRLRQTAEAILADPPDLLLTIDSPEFCLRLARRVRAVRPIHTVHYVAPSVWAWRPGRAARMAPLVDQVLALLPFEPPLMQAAGIACDFTGHPVVAEPRATPAEARAFRAAHGIGSAPLVLALPGSRRSEIARLAPRWAETLARLHTTRPDLRVVLPMAAPVAPDVRRAVAHWPFAPILIDPATDPQGEAKRAAFAAADAALAASGTVSLELALNGVPMVVGYDLARISRLILTRLLRTDTVTLVNLVTGTRHIPEFIGDACRPAPMARALEAVLADPGPQRAAMADCMIRLGLGDEAPGLRAARAILARLPVLQAAPSSLPQIPSGG